MNLIANEEAARGHVLFEVLLEVSHHGLHFCVAVVDELLHLHTGIKKCEELVLKQFVRYSTVK